MFQVKKTPQRLKKTLKESTVDTYVSRLEVLRKAFGSKTYRFLKKTKDISEYIDESWKTSSTRKITYAALFNFFKGVSKYKKYEDFYFEKMDSLRTDSNKKAKTNKASIKELENLFSYEDLRKAADNLGEQIDVGKVKEYKNRNLREYNRLLKIYANWVHLHFYAYSPPTRLEMYMATITDDEKECDSNCLYIQDDKVVYRVTDYKNKKSMGDREFNINDKVSKVLIDFYNFLKDSGLDYEGKYYLFTNYVNGEPKLFKNSNSFGQYLTKSIFKKYFGKSLTMNDLRHVFTTDMMDDPDYQKLSVGEQEILHERLLHSKEVGEQYKKFYKSKDTTALDRMIEKYGY